MYVIIISSVSLGWETVKETAMRLDHNNNRYENVAVSGRCSFSSFLTEQERSAGGRREEEEQDGVSRSNRFPPQEPVRWEGTNIFQGTNPVRDMYWEFGMNMKRRGRRRGARCIMGGPSAVWPIEVGPAWARRFCAESFSPNPVGIRGRSFSEASEGSWTGD